MANRSTRRMPQLLSPHWSNMSFPQSGGRISMSTSPRGLPIQPNRAPSSTKKSSRPGGRILGIGTSPRIRLTMHVPQVPEVQLVGKDMPHASAWSTIVSPGFTGHWPSNSAPFRKRMTGIVGGERFVSSLSNWRPVVPEDMVIPHRAFSRVQRPVCLLKKRPAFFIHLLNFVAPAPVRRMKSSRSSWAWI